MTDEPNVIDDCPCVDFTPVLVESVSFLDAPQATGVPTTVLAVRATTNIWAAVLAAFKVLGTNALKYLPQLEAQTLTVYDQYVAPFDIPMVPNAFEPAFDGMLRGVIVQGFASLKLIPPVDPQLMRASGEQCSMVDASTMASVSTKAAQDRLDELAEKLAA